MHGTRRELRVAIVGLVIAVAMSCPGCAGSARPSERPGAQARSGPGFSRPPVVDGSRVACIAPPYAPAPDATTLEDGTPIRRASETRWVLSLPGEVVPTAEQMSALVERLRARGDALRAIGYGVYCGEMPGGLCLHYEGNLCEHRVEALAQTIREAIAADPELPSPRIDLGISLAGRLGPRCDEGDAECAPIPYQSGAPWSPRGARRPGPLPQYSGGECVHDGDCVVGGCGNHCMSWEYGGAHEGATCEGYVFREPIYCGCVDDRCAWFEQ